MFYHTSEFKEIVMIQSPIQIKQPTLKFGHVGDYVKQLQKFLIKRVPDVQSLVIDGVFGEITLLAVEIFQYRTFLKQDGVVGVVTWEALYIGQRPDLPLLYRGSYCDDVAKVQSVLKFSPFIRETLGFDGYYFGKIDGIFGDQTQAAVKSFQNDKQLVVDGVIGTQTWDYLMEMAALISHFGL
jgi:murein L,D-transpeptidase YcbB/YkuD